MNVGWNAMVSFNLIARLHQKRRSSTQVCRCAAHWHLGPAVLLSCCRAVVQLFLRLALNGLDCLALHMPTEKVCSFLARGCGGRRSDANGAHCCSELPQAARRDPRDARRDSEAPGLDFGRLETGYQCRGPHWRGETSPVLCASCSMKRFLCSFLFAACDCFLLVCQQRRRRQGSDSSTAMV